MNNLFYRSPKPIIFPVRIRAIGDKKKLPNDYNKPFGSFNFGDPYGN